jgi:hypothetical protein
MRASRLQYFMASWWPLGAILGLGAVAGASIPWVVPEFLPSSPISVRAVASGAAWTLMLSLGGVLCALVLASMILPSLYDWVERRNGAPFRVGDEVVILTGHYRDTVTSVVQVGGQGGSVRVALSPEAAQSFKDWFGRGQLLRVKTDSRRD